MSRNILYVVHGNPWVEFSGTPLIAGQYALAAKKNGWNVGILTPDYPHNQVQPGADSPYAEIKILKWIALGDWSAQAFQALPCDFSSDLQLLGWPFPEFVPDVIHIVDWVGISPSLLHTLRSLNIPIIRHVWNFEDICQFIEPIHKREGTVCSPPLDPDSCGQCIANKSSVVIQGGSVSLGELKRQVNQTEKDLFIKGRARTKLRKAVLHQHYTNYYDHLLFASKSFFDYWQSFIETRVPSTIVEHGCYVDTGKLLRRHHDTLNCIYIGGANYRKGWDVVEEVFCSVFQSNTSKIRLRVYGNKEQTERSRLASYSQVSFFDAYSPEQTAEIFSWADIGIVPTRFETYCRVVREMMMCGVVPLASSAFGIPDVMVDGVNGLSIDPENPQSLIVALDRIEKNPELLNRLMSNAAMTHIKTPQEEFRAIDALYRECIEA